MGLIARARRLHYVWSWRLRYWWMDTRQGEIAHVVAFAIAVLVVIGQMVRLAVAALVAPPAGEPVQAVAWWVVQLIVLAVSAVIAWALRPKVEQPKPAAGDAPVTQDGQMVKNHFGTCWVEDEFVLAWKMMGTDKVRTKGGKK